MLCFLEFAFKGAYLRIWCTLALRLSYRPLGLLYLPSELVGRREGLEREFDGVAFDTKLYIRVGFNPLGDL